MLSPDLPLARRAALAVGVTASASLAGCDLLSGESDPGADETVSTTEPAADTDSALTEQVAERLADAAALAGAVATRFPALAPVAEGFRDLHRSHGRALGGLPASDRSGTARQQAKVRRALLAREEKLQRQLVDAAMRAESGALAQTFAAMAAAVAQRRAVAR